MRHNSHRQQFVEQQRSKDEEKTTIAALEMKIAHFSSSRDNDIDCPPARSVSTQSSNSLDAASMISSEAKVAIANWGYPGYLTKDEFNVFELFREEVSIRGNTFRSAVFSFGEEEDEAFALCRWLRARKYILREVIQMVEEAAECRKKAAKRGFYPDPQEALGVDPSIYIAQYPQLYSGISRKGCPLFISKPGVLNVGGLECITTIEGILNFHWYAMIHDFGSRLREQKRRDPMFQRYECVCVIDLANLTASQVNKRALNIVKVQSTVDSLCFPETLNRLLVVNAPSFFSMTWNIIKNWVDARTASKVEIISSRKKWERRLLELVEPNQLPSDYGGKAEPTPATLEREARGDQKYIRKFTELVSVRSTSTSKVQLAKDEKLQISVYTRSLTCGVFTVSQDDTQQKVVSTVNVKHLGKGIDEENPTQVDFPQVVQGPGQFKIRVDCNTGYFSSETFLIAGRVMDSRKPVTASVEKVHEDGSKVPPSSSHPNSPPTSTSPSSARGERLLSSDNDSDLVDLPIDSPEDVRNVMSKARRKVENAHVESNARGTTNEGMTTETSKHATTEPEGDACAYTGWSCGSLGDGWF